MDASTVILKPTLNQNFIDIVKWSEFCRWQNIYLMHKFAAKQSILKTNLMKIYGINYIKPSGCIIF